MTTIHVHMFDRPHHTSQSCIMSTPQFRITQHMHNDMYIPCILYAQFRIGMHQRLIATNWTIQVQAGSQYCRHTCYAHIYHTKSHCNKITHTMSPDHSRKRERESTRENKSERESYVHVEPITLSCSCSVW